MESSSSRSHRRDRDEEGTTDRKHSRHHTSSSRGDKDHEEDKEDRHKKHKSSSSSSSTRHHSHHHSRDRDHDHDRDRDRKDKDKDDDRHRHRHHKSSSSSSRSKSSKHHKEDKDDNPDEPLDEDDMWVEKEILASVIQQTPIRNETHGASSASDQMEVEPVKEKEQEAAVSKRAGWMLDDGGMDFGLMGALKVKKPKEEKPDPEKLHVSSRELNVHLVAGLHVDQYPVQEKPSYTIGDAGSNWRMTKLKRVFEQAAEEGIPAEALGIERFGSLEKYKDALHERKELDRRSSRRGERREGRRDEHRRKDDGRSSQEDRSRSGRLSESSSAASSPRLPQGQTPPPVRRYTPIPSPFATHVSSPRPDHSSGAPSTAANVLTPDQLNKLRARSIRARMMDMPDADKLEKEYEQAQKAIAEAASRPPEDSTAAVGPRVVVVQSMGRGSGSSSPAPALGPGNSKNHAKRKEVTHDEQGNRVAYQGDEADLDLHELVRREKLGLDEGMDQDIARRITRDAVFKDDNDYMDDNADKIARSVQRSDVQMKSAAIQDYKRTQSALDNCAMCYKDDGKTQPTMAVVSLGARVYLGLPLTKEFLPGHCMIVPIQHVTSTLECDDDAWDEIRNFMKCLIQMYASQDKAVVFFETVVNLKWQKHTVIECVPIPWEAGQAAPGYFKEAILNTDEEWSQHKKLIETDAKSPAVGGFRRRLTSKMPFFHVWFSPDKGYGHVIEDQDRFQDYFAKEVLASICEMDALQWSRKNGKRMNVAENLQRVEAFRKGWKAWDWTRTLEK